MTDTLREALDQASVALAALKLARVTGEPTRTDVLNRIDDLYAVADIVDTLLRAFGEQSKLDLGISQTDVDELFTDVCRMALDGNAVYALDQTVSAEQVRAQSFRRLIRGY